MTNSERIKDYQVIRKIGEGGFGKVFLVFKSDSFFAMKIIEIEKGQKEIKVFKQYVQLASQSPKYIVPVFDSGEFENYFYYVMPLADSLEEDTTFPPSNFRWTEKSLSKLIERKIELQDYKWFSVDEVINIILPLFDAVEFLNKNGVVHRDIKPSNILLINNKPMLSDFGLLAEDSRNISVMGTPIFAAPTWFLNTGGNPDIYGLTATFYMLISGNYPDSMGNPNYLIPDKIKPTISKELKAQYEHWYRCILRAISSNPAERFLRIQDFKNAIKSKDFESSKKWQETSKPKKSSKSLKYVITLGLLLLAYLFFQSENENTISTKSGKKEKIVQSVKEDSTNSEKEIKNFLKGKPELFVYTFRNGGVLQNSALSDDGGPRLIKSYKRWLISDERKEVVDRLEKFRELQAFAKENLNKVHNYSFYYYNGNSRHDKTLTGKDFLKYPVVEMMNRILSKSQLELYQLYYKDEVSMSKQDIIDFYFKRDSPAFDIIKGR